MKFNLLYLVFLIVLLSACTVDRNANYITYKYYSSSIEHQKKMKYRLRIPVGYNLIIKETSGESGREHQYWYNDSSVIYITDMGASLNYENLDQSQLGGRLLSKLYGDSTLRYEGRDGSGKFWKEIIIGEIQLGYKNVPEVRRAVFDEAINSLK